MKKNVIFRIAAVVLMCTLVTACFASSTFARYTSEVTGLTSKATVAKWNIEVDGEDITVANPTVTFDLFNASNIVDTVDGNTDSNVKSGLIAPGTKGEYTMTVENKSEVDAKFTIANTVTKSITDLPVNPTITSVKIGNDPITADDNGYYAIPMNAKAVVTYGWEWAFGDKAADNAYGDHTKDVTVKVDATITVDQVD